MSNWDLVRSLEFELQLPRSLCERIVDIVSESREFVTRAACEEMVGKWDGKWEEELATAEYTIKDLQDRMKQIRELT